MRLEEIYSKYDEIVKSGGLPFLECKKCKYKLFYARHICPKCGSKDLEVSNSNGIGTVFSWTKVYRKNDSFIYGIVELEEGFRVYCNITEDVQIGDKVKVNVSVLNDGKYKLLASKLR